jgi:hypothetical protein
VYATEITEASKSALLELGIALKRYHDDMILTGGWAPYFITRDYFSHCGSIDIDLVLRTKILPRYETIRNTIIGLGYVPESQFRFIRDVRSPVDGKDYPMHLDFLCDKEGEKYLDLRNVQDDLQAFMFEGLNIAFEFNFEQGIETQLPGNGEAKTTFRIVDLVGSLALKGQAMDGRLKQKDAYDIFALTHYNGGPEKAADYFNATVSSRTLSPEMKKLLERSLSVVKDKFRNENRVGPFHVESFTEGRYRRAIVAAQVDSFLKRIEYSE